MGAAVGGWAEMVQRLLGAGADPRTEADNGNTALDFAREHEHVHLESLLEA